MVGWRFMSTHTKLAHHLFYCCKLYIYIYMFIYLFFFFAFQIKILKEELSFHQQVYECQADYVESLLSAVRQVWLDNISFLFTVWMHCQEDSLGEEVKTPEGIRWISCLDVFKMDGSISTFSLQYHWVIKRADDESCEKRISPTYWLPIIQTHSSNQ